jgi:hypothetical protein
MRAIANGEKYTVPSTIEDVDVLGDIERVIRDHESVQSQAGTPATGATPPATKQPLL